MYELMLDTANLEDLKEGLDSWPVVGVTSNPTILKEEGGIDVYARLREIKALCGKKRSLTPSSWSRSAPRACPPSKNSPPGG